MHQHIQKNLFLFCRHWPSVMRWIALMTISHSERDGQWCSRGDGDWDKGTGLSDFFFFMLPSLALQGLCLQWSVWWMINMFVSHYWFACLGSTVGTTVWSFCFPFALLPQKVSAITSDPFDFLSLLCMRLRLALERDGDGAGDGGVSRGLRGGRGGLVGPSV